MTREHEEGTIYSRCRNVREILSQIKIKDREKLINLLETINIRDLIDILGEDCGPYQGSWLEPN